MLTSGLYTLRVREEHKAPVNKVRCNYLQLAELFEVTIIF